MVRLLLFFTFFFQLATARPADYFRTISWTQPTANADLNGGGVPGFEGSILRDQTGLPYWFESFELISPEAELVVSNAVFEPVLHPSAGLIDIRDTELRHHTEVGTSAGKSILRLSIFPFIKRNNQIEKLVSFTVSISENRNQLKSAAASYPWKSTSVLASGKWIKIRTLHKGIFKIPFDQLKTWGYANPDQVSMYGNGGAMLPVMNKDLAFDDLMAYPFWTGKDIDGHDCLFFYSAGNILLKENSATGMYTHQQNYYSTETFFYLTDQGIPRKIEKIAELTETAGKAILSFPNYSFHEQEMLNLISSGSQWFGERFSEGATQTINLTLDQPDLTKPAQFQVSAAGRSSSASKINLVLNGKSVQDLSFQPINTDNAEGVYATVNVAGFSENIAVNALQFKLTYTAGNSSSTAWLDYLSVNYQSLLNMNADVFSFRGKGVDGLIPVSEFVVKGASAGTKIMDVTDIQNTFEVPAVFASGVMKFKSNSPLTREYVAFNPAGSIPEPEFVGTVANQDLHATELSELIIVSNPALLSVAHELAEFHRLADQMSVQVISPELIYNEFSGGLPDPSALRNYFRMCYERDLQRGKSTFNYVLLLGDGSYDNRNILAQNHNLIPTYQSGNSLSPTESFVTDDFFVFLDPAEGGSQGIVDLGIGRIPASTLVDAEIVLSKIKNYRKPETMGNWRNTITFIGDDEDSNIHMGQAESLANFVNSAYPAFFTDKIYLDAYPQISSSGGEKYPEVAASITKRVKQGTLVMNYTGHANDKALASELVLDIPAINSWTNFKSLPVFVTATCEFSRFDSHDTSAGEHILFNPGGGGVGLFSTTRLVYSGANFILNRELFRSIFEKDEQGNNLRLGEVMRRSKAAANTGANQLNFSLLADPAMRLANPNFRVVTTSMNGNDARTEVETIPTLSVVKVKGFVADPEGAKLSSFNGEIIPTVYDKTRQVKTLGNAGQEPMNYSVQNNIIYRGLASVKNGEFEFSFFVPKDISVKLDKGKILYYAYNELADAQGYFDDFLIGGISDAAIADLNGPVLDLFMNSRSFQDGETVSASSVLLVYLTDDTGINTVGTGIGHDITAILDDDYSNILVLNDYFQADIDSYTQGSIVYPLTELAEGEHKLVVKVWDVLNNSSEKEIRFVVKDDFRIETVACYPNPMQEETHFVFTHNQADELLDVTLEVFGIAGNRVDLFQAKVASQGTESLPLLWIPADRKVKMRPGVYVFRLSLTTRDGKKSSGSGRLVFVNR